MSGSATTEEIDVPVLVVVANFAQYQRGQIIADASDIATLLNTDYAPFVVPAFVHQGNPILVTATAVLTDEAGRAITT